MTCCVSEKFDVSCKVTCKVPTANTSDKHRILFNSRQVSRCCMVLRVTVMPLSKVHRRDWKGGEVTKTAHEIKVRAKYRVRYRKNPRP